MYQTPSPDLYSAPVHPGRRILPQEHPMTAVTAPLAAQANGAARFPGMLTQGATGKPVRTLQERLISHGYALALDGEFGPATLAAVRQFQADFGLEVDGAVGPQTWRALFQAPGRPRRLGDRAYRIAGGLVGIMESGGNNRGEMVMKIIKANGGSGPEPWCGDVVAYCYRLAGSKSVTRSWAAVRLLRGVAGVRRTGTPRRGDLVRFTFSHVGIFVRDCGNGTIETIEGNTGRSGAVSDSTTGGDGVYRKVRAKGLVLDYLRVGR
jgi:peptidoglycan hydrolase-like protein with peptidoglycan-binding domain